MAGYMPVLVRSSSTGIPPAELWDAARYNLPAPLTSFVGREEEVEEVTRLLGESRLLTLTGTGGCGKTRLALAAAIELVELYPEGVWLAELSSLSEPDAVAQAVAAAVGVYEQPGRPLVETLIEELRPKKLLLVLDNCEHLVHATARLIETLLRSCPGLRVLATSRELLGLQAETNWTVLPLAVPNSEHPAGVEELEKFGSVELFVDRARGQRPGFTLTEENARTVAGICRQLDGVPLAVELAAARVGALSVEQISARLDEALDLLTGGSRTAEPRQRTLRGALDWSHELLEEPEKELFRRLSVFAGGFTLEAAETVGVGGSIDKEDILDLLSHLVDKSLVAVRVVEDVRYRLLEPIRRYALERLEQSGEAEQIQRLHAGWCLEFAERELAGPDQARWLSQLEVEHDNLRAALAWTLDGGSEDKAELGLKISAALWLFWETHGHLIEGRGWLEKALQENSEDSSPERAKALNGAGWILGSQGRYEAAIPFVEESISIYRELGEEEGIASALANLGFSAMFGMRENINLPGLLEEALELRSKIKGHRTLGMLLIFAGMMKENPEAGRKGEALHEESLELFRKVHDIWGLGTCLTSLGIMALRRGDDDRAADWLKENLEISRDLDKKKCITYSFFGLASTAANKGHPARAARLWAVSESVFEAAGLELSPLARAAVGYETQLEAVRAVLGDEGFEAAWTEGKAMTQEEAIEYALEAKENPGPEQPLTVLSRREREVAELVASGLTNREISENLVISKRTAENHVGRTLKKLGIRSREDLASWIESHPSRENRV